MKLKSVAVEVIIPLAAAVALRWSIDVRRL